MRLAHVAAQQAGLCGHDWLGGGFTTARSNWIGGPGGNGLAESYPYWLNGALPLAYLLTTNQTAIFKST